MPEITVGLYPCDHKGDLLKRRLYTVQIALRCARKPTTFFCRHDLQAHYVPRGSLFDLYKAKLTLALRDEVQFTDARAPVPCENLPALRDQKRGNTGFCLVSPRYGIPPLVSGTPQNKPLTKWLKASGLTAKLTKIVELGATNAVTLCHLDLLNARAIDREDTLNADTVRDLPNGERRTMAAPLERDDRAFKNLDARARFLLLTLTRLCDTHVYTHGVAGLKVDVISDWEELALDLLHGSHVDLDNYRILKPAVVSEA